MNFNTQICTTREQSNRLLALGVKKETADCRWVGYVKDAKGNDIPKKKQVWSTRTSSDEKVMSCGFERYEFIPAWSLHRLMALCPSYIGAFDFTLSHGYVEYVMWNDCGKYVKRLMSVNSPFDGMIDCIERLIKEGNIDKEYLEEKQ